MPKPIPPHSDFILPKFREPKAQQKLSMAFAFAISRRSNSRNIEHPWYGFWKMVVDALIDSNANFFVVPQMPLWYAPKLATTGNEGSDIGSSRKSIDSAISAAYTIPEPYTSSAYPDFAIVHLEFCLRKLNSQNLGQMSWRNIQVKSIGVPVIIENKRGGKRMPDGILFSEVNLEAAQLQCQTQAAHVFQMNHIHPDQNTILAIATTGHWWSWKIFNRVSDDMRDQYEKMYKKHAKKLKVMETKQKEKEKAKAKAKAKDHGNAQNVSAVKSSGITNILRMMKVSLSESHLSVDKEKDLDDDLTEEDGTKEFSEAEDSDSETSNQLIPYNPTGAEELLVSQTEEGITIPENDESWSAPVEFGTPASNQRLWRLYKHLNDATRYNSFTHG